MIRDPGASPRGDGGKAPWPWLVDVKLVSTLVVPEFLIGGVTRLIGWRILYFFHDSFYKKDFL